MKKIVALLTTAILLAVASPSFATGSKNWNKSSKCYFFCKVAKKFNKKYGKKKFKKYKKYTKNYKQPQPKAVPEIDAAAAAISLALVAGVVSIGRERRKRSLAN